MVIHAHLRQMSNYVRSFVLIGFVAPDLCAHRVARAVAGLFPAGGATVVAIVEEEDDADRFTTSDQSGCFSDSDEKIQVRSRGPGKEARSGSRSGSNGDPCRSRSSGGSRSWYVRVAGQEQVQACSWEGL